MFAIVFILCVVLQGTDAVIYSLNDADYARMPPVFHMDSYDTCQQDAGALYCSAEFVLVSDKPSPLLDMIKEYSEQRVTHYNHSHLRYGICVTQTCKKFFEKENEGLKLTLEACLNESMSEKYQLKVKMFDEYYCMQPGRKKMDRDLLDTIVAVICLILLLVNVVGSVCEISCYDTTKTTAVRYLLCFSIKRNWNKLMAAGMKGQDPRLQQLKSLYGIRAITTASVIVGHCSIPIVVMIKNPEFIEQSYSIKALYIPLNGTLIMQTFLMISAFLLVYIWLLHSENHQVSWNMLPKLIIIRWLRLTPSYALVLTLTVTWFRHLASGPLWGKYVAAEMNDCRQYWWQHIFYINNYWYNTSCMVQSWYLAVDTQLYILAVIIFLACRTARSRIIVLFSLFVIGITITVAHVYFQDLDGTLLNTPESLAEVFFSDPYFNKVYKRAHTNITGSIIGMATAFLVYHWQKQRVDLKKYQTLAYRLLYWSLLPVCALCCYSGGVFYSDAPRSSVYIRILYAAITKPIFAISVSIIIVGSIFKIEDLYRSILEWRGWVIPSQLSYSAYLLHMMFVRSYIASLTQTSQHSNSSGIQLACMILTTTFVAAFFFYLLVEAPMGNIIKESLSKPVINVKKN